MQRYNFVSPAPLYALIKEEFESYFNTGVIDDLLFPIWTKRAIRGFGKGLYKINEGMLFIDNYKAKLPEDFFSVREAWACFAEDSVPFRLPGTYYSLVSIKLDDPSKHYDKCDPEPCAPDEVKVIYKTQREGYYTMQKSHLLTPGTVAAKDSCDPTSLNIGCNSKESFDIRDGKFFTNFKSGEVYFEYYANEMDEDGNPLIPDNEKIQRFIEADIKFKLYERLWNSPTDETYNQIRDKVQYYERKRDFAFIEADSEDRRKTDVERIKDLNKVKTRLNGYNIT